MALLLLSKAEGEGKKEMWGHRSTWGDKEEAGGPLLARAASVSPRGHVPGLALSWLQNGRGYEPQRQWQKRGQRSPTNFWNELL